MLILKIKKYYFNIFSNKKYFKKLSTTPLLKKKKTYSRLIDY